MCGMKSDLSEARWRNSSVATLATELVLTITPEPRRHGRGATAPIIGK